VKILNKTEKVILIIVFLAIQSIFLFFIKIHYNKNDFNLFNSENNNYSNIEKGSTKKPLIQNIITINESLSPIFDISNTSRESNTPKVAVDSNKNVHIIWSDNISGTYQILYRNFTYSTQKWSKIYNLSQSNRDCINPDIEIDKNENIHVTWSELVRTSPNGHEIYYKYFRSTTKQWSNAINISRNFNADDDYSKIATNGSNIVTIAWTREEPIGGSTNITIAYYNFITHTLLKTEEIYDGSVIDSSNPDIVYSSDGTLHLVYIGNGVIRYKNMSAGTWNPAENQVGIDISTDVGNKAVFPPTIAYNSLENKIYVAWAYYPSAYVSPAFDLVMKNKTANGAFSSSYKDITKSSTLKDEEPQLEIDNKGKIYCVFKRDLNSIKLIRINDNKELQISSSAGVYSRYPSISSDINGSIYIVWEDHEKSFSEIYYRIFDRVTPHLNVITPSNNTFHSGNITIQSTVEPDNKEINYYYYNDINGDGIANDGQAWIYIGKSTRSTGWTYIWDTNQTGQKVDLKHALLKVNATDISNNDESMIIGNLTIDNTKPKICKIIQIYDNSPNIHNSSKGARHFNGTIHIRFVAIDNNSGVYKVSLYDGINFISDNSTNNEIIINTKTHPYLTDGNFSNLYIISYDRAGNKNSSVIFPEIEIDNTFPTIQFELSNYTEHNKIFWLKIKTDLDVVNVTFWNYSTSYNQKKQIFGSILHGTNEWWNISYNSYDFNGTMNFVAIVRDEMNYTVEKTLVLYIDNKNPNATILNLENGQDIGTTYRPVVIEVDVDTVNVTMFYREGVKPFKKIGFNDTFSAPYLSYNVKRKSTIIIFKEGLNVNLTSFDLRVMAIDDIGLVSNYTISLIIQTLIQDPLEEINIKYNAYKITLSWKEPIYADHFLIYRSFSPFNVQDLNDRIKNNAEELFFSIMGKNPGEEYCIASVKNNSLGDDNSYTDEVFGPRKYYYLIVIIDKTGNPSKVATTSIEIAPEEINRNVQKNQTSQWPLFFLVFIGFTFITSQIRIKRIKRIHLKGRIKKEEIKIKQKEIATFETIDLDSYVREEVSIPTVKTTKKGIFDEILAEKKEKTPSFEDIEIESMETGTINKCPTCGWILSSTATKCPRCGWRKIK